MTNIFRPFEQRKLDARNKALLYEWKEVHELCSLRDDISYTIVKTNKNGLPVVYDITYRIPTIIDLDRDKKIENKKLDSKEDLEELMYYPKFGDLHRLQITIPEKFPQIGGKPKGVITTKIWHPNVICHGDDHIVGRVCFNEGNLDASVTIVDRILQVADYLTYKNYLAEDREPYPYDLEVASWIREIAEPLGWIIPENGISYKTFGIERKEPKIRKAKDPEDILPDDDILILDDDDFEFPMEIIEDETEQEDNDQNEILEL